MDSFPETTIDPFIFIIIYIIFIQTIQYKKIHTHKKRERGII